MDGAPKAIPSPYPRLLDIRALRCGAVIIRTQRAAEYIVDPERAGALVDVLMHPMITLAPAGNC